jgi:hypothetical protein
VNRDWVLLTVVIKRFVSHKSYLEYRKDRSDQENQKDPDHQVLQVYQKVQVSPRVLNSIDQMYNQLLFNVTMSHNYQDLKIFLLYL